MRILLDKLYLLCGYLSGAFIVIMMLLIIAQIMGRLLGFIVPSVDDFSGYSLAAATFFGLAYTFKEGGHIRVTLAIKSLSPHARKIQEGLVLVLGILLTSYMAYYMVHLVWESYIFEEVSYGYIPVPIWLPQLPVALGSIMLTVAVIDDFWRLLSGKVPAYQAHEIDETKAEESAIDNAISEENH
ncbi:TRAP transporter small permease [Marinomonas agarivorans]|nr:TRAP transporter small permease [Marinomonas agarivorans]